MRFIFLLSIVFILAGCHDAIHFTEEETNYIKNKTVIVAVEKNFSPFISVNGNKIEGISADYLRLISELTGLKIILTSDNKCNLQECLDFVKEGKVDLITSVRPTPERSKYMLFTRPYINVDTVLIQRVNNPRLVGVGKGHAVIEFLKANRIDINLVEFNDDEESYRAMVAGELDAIILDEFSAISLKKKYNCVYDMQHVAHDYPLSFASKDRVLISILTKGKGKITDNEKRKIENKWK